MLSSTTVSQVVSYENELPAPGLRKCMNEQFVSLNIDVLKKRRKKESIHSAISISLWVQL